MIKGCQTGSFETKFTANSAGKIPKCVKYIGKKVGILRKTLMVLGKIFMFSGLWVMAVVLSVVVCGSGIVPIYGGGG